MISSKSSIVQSPDSMVFKASLICNLSNQGVARVKAAGIVLSSKYNDSYLDITITDGTGDIECSVFLDKNIRQFYQIPSNGQIVFVLGLYSRRIVGNKIFSKIKVNRYSVSNNMDEYLNFVIGKLRDEEQDKEVQIICATKKKIVSNKLFAREARNLLFVSALKVFENNPEFKHWVFSKDAVKNQVFVKKYLAAKHISSQEAQKGILDAIAHYLKFGIICRSQNKFSIYRSIFTKLQQQGMRVIQNCGISGINYTYLGQLLHRKLLIQKEDDYVFNAEGLSKLMSEELNEGKIMIHQNKFMFC